MREGVKMAKKLWGGRFEKATDPLVEEFTRSIQYDKKLAIYDIIGSRMHVDILKKSGYLNSKEAYKLSKALEDVTKDIGAGIFKFDLKAEDIHTDIQNTLQKKVGSLVFKLHTARSRNDMIVFSTKLYAKMAILALRADIEDLQEALIKIGNEYSNIILPGFTHMQHAQPVALKDYFMSYVYMLDRDLARLVSVSKGIKLTLGAGALAGTPIEAANYKIDASKYIDKVKMDDDFNIYPCNNSLDSVSDRDFVIEIISVLSVAAMHLSRFSEDMIIWSTKEFDFIEIDEAYCTGSSLMPQKKNADTLELIRGYASRVYGNLVSVLTMMKGLPLTYNRDMQLDKEPLFNSLEIVSMELKLLKGLVSSLKFNKENIDKQLEDESLYATDLVYYLVNKGLAFKEAHAIVGKLVKDSLLLPGGISSMSDKELKKYSVKLVGKEIIKLFDPLVSAKSKKSVKK